MSNGVKSNSYSLAVLPGRLAVCRLEGDAPVPGWARASGLFSITRTSDELSMVCDEESVPDTITAERGWRALKVKGPLEFSMIGVLARLAGRLAEAGVSIFVISTYETDYVMVKEDKLRIAIAALNGAGHQVGESASHQMANLQKEITR